MTTTATLADIARDYELVARWLKSDAAMTALMFESPRSPQGGQSRSGQISRPTEAIVMRPLTDRVEIDRRRALELIAHGRAGALELVEVLVRLGELARADGPPTCRASGGCVKPANARRGLCWSHYDAERGRGVAP